MRSEGAEPAADTVSGRFLAAPVMSAVMSVSLMPKVSASATARRRERMLEKMRNNAKGTRPLSQRLSHGRSQRSTKIERVSESSYRSHTRKQRETVRLARKCCRPPDHAPMARKESSEHADQSTICWLAGRRPVSERFFYFLRRNPRSSLDLPASAKFFWTNFVRGGFVHPR